MCWNFGKTGEGERWREQLPAEQSKRTKAKAVQQYNNKSAFPLYKGRRRTRNTSLRSKQSHCVHLKVLIVCHGEPNWETNDRSCCIIYLPCNNQPRSEVIDQKLSHAYQTNSPRTSRTALRSNGWSGEIGRRSCIEDIWAYIGQRTWSSAKHG